MKLDTSKRALGNRQSIVMAMLVRAADNNRACPSNEEIRRAIGASSVSAGPAVLASLQNAGQIVVQRTSQARQVYIVASGKSTAAIKGKPHWADRGVKREPPKPSKPDLLKGGHAFRGDLPEDRYIHRDPCPMCGIRGDLGCVHNRKAA